MPTTVVSSGELPKMSDTVASMFQQSFDYFGITAAGTMKKTFGVKEGLIISGSILLLVFLIKKVI